MTTTRTTPMKDLYLRLNGYGFTRPYIRNAVLPEWWDDDAAETAAGFAEAATIVARALGFDVRSAKTVGAELKPLTNAVRFKRRRGTTPSDLSVAERIAVQVAKMVAVGVRTPAELPATATEIRDQILIDGAPWVGLESLVAWCWNAGIPVLHVSQFPQGTPRMDGLAIRIGERPVIVVASKRNSPSWLNFIVAHELGHLALGHVAADSVLADETVNDPQGDAEEVAADKFAIELITGSEETHFTAAGRWPNADSLAKSAQRIGASSKIDPGHVALNYAHTMGDDFYPVANAALKLLQLSQGGSEIIRDAFGARFDFGALPADTSAFVMRMTGVTADEGDASSSRATT